MRWQRVAWTLSVLGCTGCPAHPIAAAQSASAEEPAAVVPGQVPLLAGADVLPPPRIEPPPATVVPMTIGSTVSGVLETGDSITPGNSSLCDYYVIHAAAGEPFTLVARGGPSIEAPSARL